MKTQVGLCLIFMCVVFHFALLAKNSGMKSVLRLQRQLGLSRGQKTELLCSIWVNAKAHGSAVGVSRDEQMQHLTKSETSIPCLTEQSDFSSCKLMALKPLSFL